MTKLARLPLTVAIAASASVVACESRIHAATSMDSLIAIAMSGATAAAAMRELILRGHDGLQAFAGAITSRLLQDIADGSQGREAAMQKAKRADKAAPSVLNCGSTSLYVQFTRIATAMESPWTIARRGGSKEPTYVVVERSAKESTERAVKFDHATVSQSVREAFGLPADTDGPALLAFLAALPRDVLAQVRTIATTATVVTKPRAKRAASAAAAA